MYRWTDPAPRAVAAIRQRRHMRRLREWDPYAQFRSMQNAQNFNSNLARVQGNFNNMAPLGAFGCPV